MPTLRTTKIILDSITGVTFACLIIGLLFTLGNTKKIPSAENAIVPIANTAQQIPSSPTQYQVESTTQTVRQELPVRLKIPKIQVDAAIEQVGVLQDGAMDQPKGPSTAVWYKLGPRPGEEGSAVIAGHFGWRDNIPALFDNLHTLQIGDKVDVVDAKGKTIAFVVRAVHTYALDEDAANVFTSTDGTKKLNLVTCTGTWNKAKESYSKRLVVFTEKEV